MFLLTGCEAAVIQTVGAVLFTYSMSFLLLNIWVQCIVSNSISMQCVSKRAHFICLCGLFNKNFYCKCPAKCDMIAKELSTFYEVTTKKLATHAYHHQQHHHILWPCSYSIVTL